MKDYKKTSSNRAAVPQGKMAAKFAAGGTVTPTAGAPAEPPKFTLKQAVNNYFKSKPMRRSGGIDPAGFMMHLMNLKKNGQLLLK